MRELDELREKAKDLEQLDARTRELEEAKQTIAELEQRVSDNGKLQSDANVALQNQEELLAAKEAQNQAEIVA